ncbi:hypothetical protein N9043_02015 [bacterium]|nr:hypothetical protein [bacterium]
MATYTLHSRVASLHGFVRPDVKQFENIADCKKHAFSNWSIAKFEDGFKYRYFARIGHTVKELMFSSFDSENGVLTFEYDEN